MFLSIASVLLSVSLGFAMPSSSAKVGLDLGSRDTFCGGYIRSGDVWSNGDGNKYWMDLPLGQYPTEMNQTKAYYAGICDTAGTKYTMSFVTLDDCQPMTKRYGAWNDNRSYTDRAYIGGSQQNITVNADASASWVCPESPDSWKDYFYKYEVYYNGLHRDEFLEKVGFKFDVVAP